MYHHTTTFGLSLNIPHPVNHKSHIGANCKAENSSIPLWDDKLYGRDLIGSWILTSHQPHQVIQWERFVKRTKSKDEGTNKAEKITVFNAHFIMSYSRARESIKRYQKFQQLPPCHILVVFQVLKRLENPPTALGTTTLKNDRSSFKTNLNGTA